MFLQAQLQFLNTVIDDALKECKTEEERNVFVKLNSSFQKQYDNGVLNEKELEQLTDCFNREMRKEWELENTIENFNESQKKFYDNIEPLKLGDIEINDWSKLSTEHKAVLDYRVDELKKIREKRYSYYSHLNS